jgi:hypothetical protein
MSLQVLNKYLLNNSKATGGVLLEGVTFTWSILLVAYLVTSYRSSDGQIRNSTNIAFLKSDFWFGVIMIPLCSLIIWFILTIALGYYRVRP